MNITKIDMTLPEHENKKHLLGIADVTFDYEFTVHDIKILDGAKGPYLEFPMNKYKKFVTYPITEDMRQYILNTLLDALIKGDM